MNLRLINKPLTQEDKDRLIESAKESNEFFVKFVVPFFSKKVVDACSRGWKMQVGVSHYWLEGYAGLRVMLGGNLYGKEKWIHISLSRKERLPSWGDIKKVKELFLGDDLTAIQVFPPKDQFINDNPYVLHLWHRLGGKPLLPDFRLKDPRTGKISI